MECLMKKIIVAAILILSTQLHAEADYQASNDFPFGRPNPDAPAQILDYKYLIGTSECKSRSRKPDQTWADPVNMTWSFKYILNGMGVQDETLKDDGRHSGSIRQYSKSLGRWFVHYYTTVSIPNNRIKTAHLPVWEGNLKKDQIVLYNEQKAPNGMEGFSRLTFSDMTKKSFNWTGAWVDKEEKIVYENWKISCKKR